MNRRRSDRIRIIFGMAILWVIGAHFIGLTSGMDSTLGVDFVYGAFGLVTGYLFAKEQ